MSVYSEANGTPNHVLQRTAPVCHAGCLRSRRASPPRSLILFSLGVFPMNWHIVAHTVAGVNGLLLFISPFAGRTRAAPGFVRVQLFLAGVVTIAWSVIGIYVYSHQADSSHTLLPWPQYWHLMLTRWTLAGIGIGVLATLFTNPQFYRWRRESHAST